MVPIGPFELRAGLIDRGLCDLLFAPRFGCVGHLRGVTSPERTRFRPPKRDTFLSFARNLAQHNVDPLPTMSTRACGNDPSTAGKSILRNTLSGLAIWNLAQFSAPLEKSFSHGAHAREHTRGCGNPGTAG